MEKRKISEMTIEELKLREKQLDEEKAQIKFYKQIKSRFPQSKKK